MGNTITIKSGGDDKRRRTHRKGVEVKLGNGNAHLFVSAPLALTLVGIEDFPIQGPRAFSTMAKVPQANQDDDERSSAGHVRKFNIYGVSNQAGSAASYIDE